MMLDVNGLEASYDESQILFGVSLSIAHGEVVTLLGRNGMGKTTTVSTLMGILPAKRGEIVFDGVALHRLPSYRVAQCGLALVPEGRHIFPNLSVRENLIATARGQHGGPAAWTLTSVLELFPLLHERLDSWGGLLSGGEQQMLAIGRALMTNPRLLILDEATEGLAPMVRREIWQVLKALKQRGQSILVIDKNVEVLSRIADRHYILEKGRVVWSGSSAALQAEPALKERYLGI
ncbi:MAG TPA: ABC transporter ATP-binding protein [Xanthobacteraceae bacterium]|jgi:branched-chain amino acid transport system ATP-binding protein|nr:ABC transporter ATP-binding protein [Xanthobacteraceae bacterium]